MNSFHVHIPAILYRNIATPLLLLAGLISCFAVTTVHAQSSTIQGVVTESNDGRPLEGANIVLEEISELQITRGTATDRNGFYQIQNLYAGTYQLQISHIGYITYQDTLILDGAERMVVSVDLDLDDELLDEVLVALGEGAARRQIGRQRVTTVDISRVPTPAGGGDLASYLQAMPGVVATGDRGGQLFVRGGTPSENMVLIDGSLIYQPFHIVGFFSVFPEDLVSSADFYTGGFSPRYSGRTSSVLDVQMRDGNRHKIQGTASVSPYLGEILLEGPIRKEETSWIMSIRRSLIKETSPLLLGDQQPLQFDSQYLKVSQFSRNSDSRCSVMALRTGDQGRIDFESNDTFRWNNFVLGGQCILPPEESDVLVDTNISFSYMSNSMGNSIESELTSSISRVHMGVNLTQFSGRVRYNYGFFTQLKSMDYKMIELFRSPQFNEETLLSFGTHIEATIPLSERFQLYPGAALTFYMDDYKPSFEPRLRSSWQPLGRYAEELYATVGLYRQPLTGVSDMRDVSSVFVAWMPVPREGSQMTSMNTLIGWQQSLGAGFQWSVEGYYKRLKHIPVTVWNTLAEFTTDLAIAHGTVLGNDIRLEFNRGKWYALLGYGLSWTQYESAQEHFSVWFGEKVQRYHPPHDRRHQFNSMLGLTLGHYKLGLRWQLGTGFPYTRPMGFDGLLRFTHELPDVRTNYGTPRVILDRPYQGRLPTFHRLDLSVERSFSFSAGQMQLQAGAINLYNHRNLFYYDVYTHRRIDQMPFAPYVSLKLEPN